MYLCSVRGAFNPARDTSLIPARAYSGFFIASILSFPMQYISLNCLYCDVPFRPENFALLALLVGELLSPLDGILFSDVEEPVFEENDDFFHCFVCYLKINVYICGRKVPCLCWIVVPAVTWGFFIFSEILGYWHYLRYYRE